MTSYCCSSSCDLTARVRRGVSVYHEKSVECTRRCDRFSASSRFLDNERTLREEGRVLGEKKKKKKRPNNCILGRLFRRDIFPESKPPRFGVGNLDLRTFSGKKSSAEKRSHPSLCEPKRFYCPFTTAVPFWGQTTSKLDWFVPKTGLQP